MPERREREREPERREREREKSLIWNEKGKEFPKYVRRRQRRSKSREEM